jgi:hypothetical protein
MTHSWKDIRPLLSPLSQDKLLAIIQDLYKFRKENRDFLHSRFTRGVIGLDAYKATIEQYMFPKEPWKKGRDISLSKARKAISDYRQAVNDPIGLVDLMVFYVECGTGFTCEFGDIGEQFYNSLESMFAQSLALMKKHPAEEMDGYVAKLRDVVRRADGIGWGYYDTISEMLADYMNTTKVLETHE